MRSTGSLGKVTGNLFQKLKLTVASPSQTPLLPAQSPARLTLKFKQGGRSGGHMLSYSHAPARRLGWSGSAFIGGWLVDNYGYGGTFPVTLAMQVHSRAQLPFAYPISPNPAPLPFPLRVQLTLVCSSTDASLVVVVVTTATGPEARVGS